jgi:hypothetical protein
LVSGSSPATLLAEHDGGAAEGGEPRRRNDDRVERLVLDIGSFDAEAGGDRPVPELGEATRGLSET